MNWGVWSLLLQIRGSGRERRVSSRWRNFYHQLLVGSEWCLFSI